MSLSVEASSDECRKIVETGELITVPVVLDTVAGIEGMDIEVNFDPDILGFQGASLAGGILEGLYYNLEANTKIPGQSCSCHLGKGRSD